MGRFFTSNLPPATFPPRFTLNRQLAASHFSTVDWGIVSRQTSSRRSLAVPLPSLSSEAFHDTGTWIDQPPRIRPERPQSLTALVLIEGLWSRRLLGNDVTPILDAWFKELNAISQDVHDHRKKDVEYQQALERLYKRVDLNALLKTLDFDALASTIKFPEVGAKSLPVDFSHVGGLPAKLPFGGQIFAMRKGRSVVPHGHDNMATGFLVLKGDFRGRHYDRIEDHPDHYIIRPTLDRVFDLVNAPPFLTIRTTSIGSPPRVKPDSSSTCTSWTRTLRTPKNQAAFTWTRWARSCRAA